MKCGRVFFDISVDPWTEGCEPTVKAITAEAASFAVGIGMALVVGAVVPIVGAVEAGAMISAESLAAKYAQINYKAAKISEVLSDGKMVVISGGNVTETECILSITAYADHGILTSLSGDNPLCTEYQASYTPYSGADTEAAVPANTVDL